jgi:hypothetical protein
MPAQRADFLWRRGLARGGDVVRVWVVSHGGGFHGFFSLVGFSNRAMNWGWIYDFEFGWVDVPIPQVR